MGTAMFTPIDAVYFIICGGLLVLAPAVKFGIEIGRLRERDSIRKAQNEVSH